MTKANLNVMLSALSDDIEETHSYWGDKRSSFRKMAKFLVEKNYQSWFEIVSDHSTGVHSTFKFFR